MLKPQNVPHGRHNDYSLIYTRLHKRCHLKTLSILELRCDYERDLSHMVQEATFPSLTALSGTRVSENSLEPSPAGISDLRAEISWCIVMVQRSGKASRRYRCQLYFSLSFQPFCLKHDMRKTQ